MTTPYNELRVLIAHYGRVLADNPGGSYSDIIETLDRLTTLRAELKKSWDNR